LRKHPRRKKPVKEESFKALLITTIFYIIAVLILSYKGGLAIWLMGGAISIALIILTIRAYTKERSKKVQ